MSQRKQRQRRAQRAAADERGVAVLRQQVQQLTVRVMQLTEERNSAATALGQANKEVNRLNAVVYDLLKSTGAEWAGHGLDFGERTQSNGSVCIDEDSVGWRGQAPGSALGEDTLLRSQFAGSPPDGCSRTDHILSDPIADLCMDPAGIPLCGELIAPQSRSASSTHSGSYAAPSRGQRGGSLERSSSPTSGISPSSSSTTWSPREGALRLTESIGRAAVRHEADRALAAELAAMLNVAAERFAAQRRAWRTEMGEARHEATTACAETAALKGELFVATAQLRAARLSEPLTRAEQSARDCLAGLALADLRALADSAVKRGERLARAAGLQMRKAEADQRSAVVHGARRQLAMLLRRAQLSRSEVFSRSDARRREAMGRALLLAEAVRKVEKSARAGLVCSEAESRRQLRVDCARLKEEVARAVGPRGEAAARGVRAASWPTPGEVGTRQGTRRRRPRRGSLRCLAKPAVVDQVSSLEPGSTEVDPDETGSSLRDRGAVNSACTPDPASPSTAASEALFIDHICFWLAAFAPKAWSPVCSKSARAVLGTVTIFHSGWRWLTYKLAIFQTMGRHNATDNDLIGPGVGEIYWAKLDVQELLPVVRAAFPRGPGSSFWGNRWVIHIELTLNLYEEMRLKHRAMYLAGLNVLRNLRGVKETLIQVLAAFDHRTAPELEDGADST
eukprot:TRINITY_DN8491_c0_g1_i2.p1 TRINITY_DN8491_c0_g1~~TRINITY_DN8491_c0_g1_i2.p1  ORF type:complete len:680 (+),score=98.47 TRINITY_DN8491_c0_g1_i2:81-2120(+)